MSSVNKINLCDDNSILKLEEFSNEWRRFGAVSTPRDVVRFMIKVSGVEKWERLKILEPGCGFYDFSREIYCMYPNNEFTGVEINPRVYEVVSRIFPFRTILADFLLWETEERFDLVIGNPPYGIPGERRYPISVDAETKKLYRRIYETWRGKYNVYGLFIEKGLKLLREGGRLVYVIPCTFMILDEFSKLREFLARTGEVNIYYIGRVFEKNVVACVLVVLKDARLRGRLKLYEVRELKNVILWYERSDYKGDIIRFENDATREFEKGKPLLGELFELHFAARSIEYYRNPKVSREPKPGYLCVLKGDNLKPGWIDYENCYTKLWVPRDSVGEFRWFYTIPHIVVGHTKGGRVVAAVDERCYPWREEIHLIPKIPMTIDEMKRIVNYLNSREVQEYMRTLYKDITPHTTITQLKLLPLPEEYIRYLKRRTLFEYMMK